MEPEKSVLNTGGGLAGADAETGSPQTLLNAIVRGVESHGIPAGTDWPTAKQTLADNDGQWKFSAVLVAIVLDGMDGRIARWTRTESEFGAEYDSLSDMVSFGAAPALVMYVWALSDLGKLGWISAFIYCAGAALRLARFNTNIEVVDKRFFQGMPSPAAAALVAGLVWVLDDLGIRRADWIAWIACAFTIFAGITMVSNMPFYSFKDLNLRKRVPFWAVLAVVAGIVVIAYRPPAVLFLLFVCYALSGYVLWFVRRARRRPAS